MTERWILNASPVIALARIGQTDLLGQLSDQVVVPQAVALEILAGPTDDNARKLVEAGKFTVIETSQPSVELLAWDLGAGETAVIAQAHAQRG